MQEALCGNSSTREAVKFLPVSSWIFFLNPDHLFCVYLAKHLQVSQELAVFHPSLIDHISVTGERGWCSKKSDRSLHHFLECGWCQQSSCPTINKVTPCKVKILGAWVCIYLYVRSMSVNLPICFVPEFVSTYWWNVSIKHVAW